MISSMLAADTTGPRYLKIEFVQDALRVGMHGKAVG